MILFVISDINTDVNLSFVDMEFTPVKMKNFGGKILVF